MIKLLGVPHDINSSFLRGTAMAPARIRLMDSDGSANTASESGGDIMAGKVYKDLGDLDFDNANAARSFAIILERVQKEISKKDQLISFGGDHSISFPIIDAFTEVYPNLNVLQLDAHGDLYENFQDNPFSHASPFARLMEKGKVASLTQVGVRTLNKHQKDQVKKFKVNVVEAREFNLDFLKKLQGPLYLSLDMDVLDPAFAPGVSHHEPGGLSSRDVLRIIQGLPVKLVGADIVEYNPSRDIQNMTAMVAYKFFKEIAANMLG